MEHGGAAAHVCDLCVNHVRQLPRRGRPLFPISDDDNSLYGSALRLRCLVGGTSARRSGGGCSAKIGQ
jgi:hypothetical protein